MGKFYCKTLGNGWSNINLSKLDVAIESSMNPPLSYNGESDFEIYIQLRTNQFHLQNALTSMKNHLFLSKDNVSTAWSQIQRRMIPV